MADPSALALAPVAVGQTVIAYQFFLPRLSDVRRSDPTEPGMRGDVLMGQIAAGVLSIGVGIMFSSLTNSPVPVIVAILTALVIGALYHYAMNGRGLFE